MRGTRKRFTQADISLFLAPLLVCVFIFCSTSIQRHVTQTKAAAENAALTQHRALWEAKWREMLLKDERSLIFASAYLLSHKAEILAKTPADGRGQVQKTLDDKIKQLAKELRIIRWRKRLPAPEEPAIISGWSAG